jgi:hypothetical protein
MSFGLNSSWVNSRPPSDPRSIVFRAVEQVLKSDPVLSSCVPSDHWRSWRGEGEDNMPPSPSQCPFIRLSNILSTPPYYASESTYNVGTRIRIETVVSGSCIDDSIDLWGAIENALQFGKEYPIGSGQILQIYFRTLFNGLVPAPIVNGSGVYEFNWENVNVGVQTANMGGGDGVGPGPVVMTRASGEMVFRVLKRA